MCFVAPSPAVTRGLRRSRAGLPYQVAQPCDDHQSREGRGGASCRSLSPRPSGRAVMRTPHGAEVGWLVSRQGSERLCGARGGRHAARWTPFEPIPVGAIRRLVSSLWRRRSCKYGQILTEMTPDKAKFGKSNTRYDARKQCLMWTVGFFPSGRRQIYEKDV